MTRNMFRTVEGKLDRQYMRICACYKLLKLGKMTRADAIKRINERADYRRDLGETMTSIWFRGPLKGMAQ